MNKDLSCCLSLFLIASTDFLAILNQKSGNSTSKSLFFLLAEYAKIEDREFVRRKLWGILNFLMGHGCLIVK